MSTQIIATIVTNREDDYLLMHLPEKEVLKVSDSVKKIGYYYTTAEGVCIVVPKNCKRIEIKGAE